LNVKSVEYLHGYYSNKSRGMRKKAGSDSQVPALVESAVPKMPGGYEGYLLY
jgi:hypothetical protein